MAEVKNNESNGKTLLVVLIICLVCSIVVASAAVGLKSRQQEQRALDRQRNILAVAGLMHHGMSSEEVSNIFAERISARLVDLNTGEFLDKEPAKFDHAQAVKDPLMSLKLEVSQDPAGIKRRSHIAEVYLVRDAQNRIQELVLPVYGNGLWSVMHSLVSIETDGKTIKGIIFYDHGETPGLGGEIENPNWRAQFVGKKALNEDGQPALRIVKGSARQDDHHAVDGLSGATLTANGVQNSFDFWMGELGFGPFLKNVREGALNNV